MQTVNQQVDINDKFDLYLKTRLKSPEQCRKIIAFYASQEDIYKLQAIFQLNSYESAKFLSKVFKKYHDNSDILTMTDIVNLLSIISTIIRPANQDSGSSQQLVANHNDDLNKLCLIPKSNCFHSIIAKFTNDTELQLIFQEQLMKLLAYLFDINLGEADLLRRDFEKRKFDKIESKKESLYQNWKQKAVKLVGQEIYDRSFDELWSYLVSVTGYSFNKSHAVVYSLLTYITTGMKLFDTAKFYSSAININLDKTDKLKGIINETSWFDIKLVTPSIKNCYFKSVAINDKTISMPIGIVKGIGRTTAKMLCERKFANINEFIEFSLTRSSINKKVISILIDIGFFRDFGLNREESFNAFMNYKKVDRYNVKMTFYKTLNGKKYNDYAYKPKKNEVVIKENIETNIATIEKIEQPFIEDFNCKNKPYKFNSFINSINGADPDIELRTIIDHFGFMPFDYKFFLSDKLKNDKDIILIDSITARKDKNGNKFWIITDLDEKKYYYNTYDKKPSLDSLEPALKKHLSVVRIAYTTNEKGFNSVKKLEYCGNLYINFAQSANLIQ